MNAQTATAQDPGIASLYDPVLPHLQALLHCQMMSELLAHLMDVDTGRYRAEGCEIERVKYKPAKNCLVVYQLTLFDRNRQVSTRMRLVCRTFERAGSHSRYIKALRQLIVATLPSTPRVFHIPELEIVAWAFPHERKLHSLPVLSDEKRLVDTLLDVVLNSMGAHWHIESVNHRIVHYVPEHTCSLRVALTLNNRQSGLTRPWVIFGKTYYNDDGRRTEQLAQQLYLAGQDSGGSVAFPRPLYYNEAERILWQEGLMGETLRQVSPDDRTPMPLLAATARALAVLHQMPAGPLPTTQIDDILNCLQQRCDQLSRVSLIDRTRLAQVVNRLQETAGRLNPSLSAILHGDLHPQNIFVQDSGVALIDLDNLTLGSPLLDIGSWIAGVLYRACLRDEPPQRLADYIRGFVLHYQAHVP